MATKTVKRGSFLELNRRRFAELGLAATLLSAQPFSVHAKATTPIVSAGGGGRFPRDLLKRTIRLAGGNKSRVVICPFGYPDQAEATKFATKLFREAGARNAEVLSLKSAGQAIEQVKQADIIWYSGGFQKRQVLALSGVPGLVSALQQAHRNGTAMIGGSAGAAVMSKLMISGGSNGTAYTRAGLGFLPGIVLDQHVTERNREWRLRQVISRNRDLIGVGIDEGAGVLIQADKLRVFGSNKIILVQWTGGGLKESNIGRNDTILI